MTGGSLGLRTGSYGSLQNTNSVIAGGGGLLPSKPFTIRKNSIKMLSASREKDRSLSFVWCRYLGRRKVSMLLLIAFALLVFVLGSFVVNKESTSPNVDQQIRTLGMVPYINGAPRNPEASRIIRKRDKQKNEDHFVANNLKGGDRNRILLPDSKGASIFPFHHPCTNFIFPPPPPPNRRRIGPRRKFQLDLVIVAFHSIELMFSD